jgi:KTSC domain
MDMVKVSSSAIEAVGYDHATRQMKIRFTSGKVYDFCNVPEPVHRELMNATSLGRYYNENIKDKYPC